MANNKHVISSNGGKVHAQYIRPDGVKMVNRFGNEVKLPACGRYGMTDTSNGNVWRSATTYVWSKRQITCSRKACQSVANSEAVEPVAEAPKAIKGYPVHSGLGRQTRPRRSRRSNAGPKSLQELLEL